MSSKLQQLALWIAVVAILGAQITSIPSGGGGSSGYVTEIAGSPVDVTSTTGTTFSDLDDLTCDKIQFDLHNIAFGNDSSTIIDVLIGTGDVIKTDAEYAFYVEAQRSDTAAVGTKSSSVEDETTITDDTLSIGESLAAHTYSGTVVLYSPTETGVFKHWVFAGSWHRGGTEAATYSIFGDGSGSFVDPNNKAAISDVKFEFRDSGDTANRTATGGKIVALCWG